MRRRDDPESTSRIPYSDRAAAAALFAAAFILRLVFQLASGDRPAAFTGYLREAGGLVSSGWLSGHASSTAPLYLYWTALLTGPLDLGPHALMLIQALMGALTCTLIYTMLRTLASRRAALAAGLLAVLYSPFIVYETVLVPATLFVLLITLALVMLSRSQGSTASYLAGGICLGLAASLRAEFLLLLAPAAAAALLSPGHRGRRLRRVSSSLVVLAGAAAVIAVFACRQRGVSEDRVLVGAGLGPGLYAASSPGATGLHYTELQVEHHQPRGEARRETIGAPLDQALYRKMAERVEGRKLGPREVSRFWMREALLSATRRPAFFRDLVLRKAYCFWNPYEAHDTVSALLGSRALRPWPLVTMCAVAPLALVGMFLAFRERRRLFMLYALAAVAFLASLAFHSGSRLRLAAAPALIAFAGLAIDGLVLRYTSDRKSLVKPAAAVLVLLCLLNASQIRERLRQTGPGRTGAGAGVGGFLGETALLDEAIAHTASGDEERAVTEWSRLADNSIFYSRDAHRTLAEIYASMGDEARSKQEMDRALGVFSFSGSTVPLPYDTGGTEGETLADTLARYEARTSRNPSDIITGNTLGLLYLASGMYSEAVNRFSHLVHLEPHHPTVLYNFGYALSFTGDYEGTVRALNSALDAGLKFSALAADAHFNMAASYHNMPDLVNATRHCKRALELRPDFDKARYALALLYLKAGDNEAARPELEKLRDSPAFAPHVEGILRKIGPGKGGQKR